MTLVEFKNYIESFEGGKVFDYGISEPFSWRGSYDEVAFKIFEAPTAKENVLYNINKAYTDVFDGCKGGKYSYDDWTEVNFEEGYSNWTDGGYCQSIIAKIEGSVAYSSLEEKLVNLAFPKKNKKF